MLIIVTGMRREARIVGRAGGAVVIAGSATADLAGRIEAAVQRGARAVISIGIGGGLAPGLPVGTAVVATGIVSGDTRLPTNDRWRQRMVARLPRAVAAAIAGSDRIVGAPAGKAALHRQTGAVVVDMESHIAAAAAAARDLPFAALRVVSDAAGDALPPAVLGAISPDGDLKLATVVGSVAGRPTQIPRLIRTARNSGRAMASLGRCVTLLGAGLACPYLG